MDDRSTKALIHATADRTGTLDAADPTRGATAPADPLAWYAIGQLVEQLATERALRAGERVLREAEVTLLRAEVKALRGRLDDLEGKVSGFDGLEWRTAELEAAAAGLKTGREIDGFRLSRLEAAPLRSLFPSGSLFGDGFGFGDDEDPDQGEG